MLQEVNRERTSIQLALHIRDGEEIPHALVWLDYEHVHVDLGIEVAIIGNLEGVDVPHMPQRIVHIVACVRGVKRQLQGLLADLALIVAVDCHLQSLREHLG